MGRFGCVKSTGAYCGVNWNQIDEGTSGIPCFRFAQSSFDLDSCLRLSFSGLFFGFSDAEEQPAPPPPSGPPSTRRERQHGPPAQQLLGAVPGPTGSAGKPSRVLPGPSGRRIFDGEPPEKRLVEINPQRNDVHQAQLQFIPKYHELHPLVAQCWKGTKKDGCSTSCFILNHSLTTSGFLGLQRSKRRTKDQPSKWRQSKVQQT